MKIMFYDTKPYDKESFERVLPSYPEVEMQFIKPDLDKRTAALAEGFDAVCAFVSSDIGAETLQVLNKCKVRLVLLRCAGFNNVDLDTAKDLHIEVR